jgi:F0F1-type ATP synthase membrane subunit b/b'
MKEWLQDPVHIYAVAFVLFWVMVYAFLRKPCLRWLDDQIAKISAELKTAQELRSEAEVALTECKAKQAHADEEVVRILETAKGQVESMRKQAESDVTAELERLKHASTERIRMAEEKALAAVRDHAVQIGMELARKELSDKMSENDAARLIDHAIDDVALLKATKAKKSSS